MFFDFQLVETCRVIQQERRRKAKARELMPETEREHPIGKRTFGMVTDKTSAQPECQAQWTCGCAPRVEQPRSALG